MLLTTCKVINIDEIDKNIEQIIATEKKFHGDFVKYVSPSYHATITQLVCHCCGRNLHLIGGRCFITADYSCIFGCKFCNQALIYEIPSMCAIAADMFLMSHILSDRYYKCFIC